MDVLSAFKSEIFRPLATLVVPGATAVSPYIVLAIYYNKFVADFWTAHPNHFAFFVGVAIIATGFILEDLGSRLESGVWDEIIESKTSVQFSDWRAYLAKEYTKDAEPIGQHYLRTILMRFKFELSFGLALVFCWFGLLWLQLVVTPRPWNPLRFSVFSFFMLVGAVYLLWESYGGSWVLADVRHVLLTGKKLDRARQSLDAASRSLRIVLTINAVAAIALGLLLIVSPTRRLFLAIPESPVYDAFVRLAGASVVALGIAAGALATVRLIRLVRTVGVSLFAVHLLLLVILLLPRGKWTPSTLAIVVWIITAGLMLGYGFIALKRATNDTTDNEIGDG